MSRHEVFNGSAEPVEISPLAAVALGSGEPEEPVSQALLDAYDEWLDLERSWLKWERFGSAGMDAPDRADVEVVYRNRLTGEIFDYRRCNMVIANHGRPGDSPSCRAAAILSAAGAQFRDR